MRDCDTDPLDRRERKKVINALITEGAYDDSDRPTLNSAADYELVAALHQVVAENMAEDVDDEDDLVTVPPKKKRQAPADGQAVGNVRMFHDGVVESAPYVGNQLEGIVLDDLPGAYLEQLTDDGDLLPVPSLNWREERGLPQPTQVTANDEDDSDMAPRGLDWKAIRQAEAQVENARKSSRRQSRRERLARTSDGAAPPVTNRRAASFHDGTVSNIGIYQPAGVDADDDMLVPPSIKW